MNTPHNQPQSQPGLELSADAIKALRSLSKMLERLKQLDNPGEADEEELIAAVERAVAGIDSGHTFGEETMEEVVEGDKSRPPNGLSSPSY